MPPHNSAEQLIRATFVALPRIVLNVQYPITVEYNGVTQNFFAHQKIICNQTHKSTIHLSTIKRGRLLRGDAISNIVSSYALSGKDVLRAVGLPCYATENELKIWAAAGFTL